MEFDEGKLIAMDFNVEFLNLKDEITFLVIWEGTNSEKAEVTSNNCSSSDLKPICYC